MQKVQVNESPKVEPDGAGRLFVFFFFCGYMVGGLFEHVRSYNERALEESRCSFLTGEERIMNIQTKAHDHDDRADQD